jgi:hypothetical protein
VSVPDPSLFPALALPDLEGNPRPLDAAWSEGRALILVGHGDCRTTREALPYVDRIHRRREAGTSVVAVLQDDSDAASDLVAELDLDVPVVLEPDPYPLARSLDLVAVPTLYLVERGGAIEQVSIGLRRSDLEGFAARLGVPGPLFTPADQTPELRPG